MERCIRGQRCRDRPDADAAQFERLLDEGIHAPQPRRERDSRVARAAASSAARCPQRPQHDVPRLSEPVQDVCERARNQRAPEGLGGNVVARQMVARQLTSMRILVVEDDRQLRASMTRGLREAEHDVEQATTGAQAIAMAAADPFDVMILDVRLPDIDGLSVCRAIRGAGSRLPILMLTALDGIDQRIAGLDAGADDYLSKPFAFGELLARLRALGRRRLGALAATIVGGDLT